MDWAGLLRLGLGHLQMHPSEFWALTPNELVLKLGLDARSAPMTRAALEVLAQDFPDAERDATNGT